MIEYVLTAGPYQADRLARRLSVDRGHVLTVREVLDGKLRGVRADRIFYSDAFIRTAGSLAAIEDARLATATGGEVLHADHWDMLHETTQQQLPPHERMLALSLRAAAGMLRDRGDAQDMERRARQAIVEHGWQRGIRVYAPRIAVDWASRRELPGGNVTPWLDMEAWHPNYPRREWRITAYWSAPLEVG